jgi:hypothetical protein
LYETTAPSATITMIPRMIHTTITAAFLPVVLGLSFSA